jgi:exosortase E/protease (VPEID-CTERM system)
LAINVDCRPASKALATSCLIRWTGLAGLLLAESALLATGPAFHEGLAYYPPWVVYLIHQRLHALQLSLVIVTATALFGGRALGEELLLLGSQVRPYRWWPWILAHLTAFALTALLLIGFFDQARPLDPLSGVALALVAVAGLASLLFWCLAVMPRPLWVAFWRQGWKALLAGFAIGAPVWLAAWSTDQLWKPLSQATLWVVYDLLKLTGSEVICDPASALIGTSSFLVTIEPACSGYQGIGLILAFLGVFLYLFRHQLRFPQALLLLPIGALVAWLANAARLTALVIIGTWVSPDIAMNGFHSFAGWLAFNAIALGIIVLAQHSPFLMMEPLHTFGSTVAAPYLLPLLAVMATVLVTSAFSSGFDYFYPARVLVGAGVLLYFRRYYAGLGWSWSWWPVAVGATVFGIWVLLDLLGDASPSQKSAVAPLARLSAGLATAWVGCRAVGFVIIAPCVEELAFRGYLTRRVIAANFESVPLGRFTLLSFLVSSAAFGALHGRWLAGTLAGMLYALALYRYGRLSHCVTAHATTNALLASSALATGKWSLLS